MTDSAFPNPNKKMRPVMARLISFIPAASAQHQVFRSSLSLYLVLQILFSYSLYLNLPPVFPILKTHPTKPYKSILFQMLRQPLYFFLILSVAF
jgi:hypothetical protein